ncbi:MAG: MmgE/PrpD family protein [Rhodospirillales bacterium]
MSFFDDELHDLSRWVTTPPVDEAVEKATRRLLLDTFACAVGGFSRTPLGLLSSDGEGFHILGTDYSLGASETAYALALAACADEACEGLAFAHGRPGLHSVAAGIGAALRTDANLGDLLDGVRAGFEFSGRMGALFRAKPGIHVDGSWGLVGAAVAASRIYSGTSGHIVAAATAALCQMPAGLYLPVTQGSDIRNTYSGHAAATGMLLAASTAMGMRVPSGAVEAAAGYAFALDEIAWTPSGRHLILEGYLKPYPSVRHTHYGIQAARSWHQDHSGISAEKIETCLLEIYPEAVTYCGNRAPTTPIMAQFSLTYTLAHTLTHGDLTPAAYSADSLTNPEKQALEALIEIKPVEALGLNGNRSAQLSITTKEKAWSTRVNRVPGDALEPLSDDFLANKVRIFCSERIETQRIERLIGQLMTGSKQTPVREIFTV